MNDTAIIAGAAIAQLSLIAIMAVAAFMVSAAERHSIGCFPYVVLFTAIITIIPLMFTRGYSGTWGQLVGVAGEVGISRSISMLIVFLVDIVAVHALVWSTGGSRESPFQAVYFLLPTLAIFLREPLGHLMLYLVLIGASYTWLMFGKTEELARNYTLVSRLAYWFTAVACLVLATYIGYTTRP